MPGKDAEEADQQPERPRERQVHMPSSTSVILGEDRRSQPAHRDVHRSVPHRTGRLIRRLPTRSRPLAQTHRKTPLAQA